MLTYSKGSRVCRGGEGMAAEACETDVCVHFDFSSDLVCGPRPWAVLPHLDLSSHIR